MRYCAYEQRECDESEFTYYAGTVWIHEISPRHKTNGEIIGGTVVNPGAAYNADRMERDANVTGRDANRDAHDD